MTPPPALTKILLDEDVGSLLCSVFVLMSNFVLFLYSKPFVFGVEAFRNLVIVPMLCYVFVIGFRAALNLEGKWA